MNKESIIKNIVSTLTPLSPAKVFLFGSYARGTAKDDSDVDIYIVSNEDFIPASYAENMRHYKKYSKPLKALKHEIALDLIVHTKAMHRLFEDGDSSFFKEITKHGERLI